MKFTPRFWRTVRRMSIGVAAPAVPTAFWWKYAHDERQKRAQDVKTRVRLPNVQTVDDLMVEKCRPGDVILFDRRPELCASGPWAALSCIVARALLCDDGDEQVRSVDHGKFDHCGIVVPGYVKSRKDKFDPSNLLVLEATAGEGVIARPLLTRIEMSQSRSMILLPLASSGERRNDENYEMPPSTKRIRDYMDKQFVSFRDTWVNLSEKGGYKWAHSTLCLGGAMAYATNLQKFSSGPVSPSAWVVVLALKQAGVYQDVAEERTLSIKVEDFLRDHRFQEQESVRLRPGFKFLGPVSMRESSMTG
ncbi:expressed unknown protein [Seminavis robusta]|uniref:Uncharacterized protein n=1 Tax=Seminavis robusta TaxID=568900 RepID=A0A9N8H2Q4_9STRA|nr:expressed unknown protein [Seminavis robusta]|eukprot:Sro70_g039120.1 n/a (306) ;mRNA; r:114660-115687